MRPLRNNETEEDRKTRQFNTDIDRIACYCMNESIYPEDLRLNRNDENKLQLQDLIRKRIQEIRTRIQYKLGISFT